MSGEASSLVSERITQDDMWDVCAALAWEIEVDQGARLLVTGLADRSRARRAEVLTNVCRCIEVVKPIEADLRALIARKRGWDKNRRGGAA